MDTQSGLVTPGAGRTAVSEDKSQKTLPPTPHKLREARKKGQVAKSPDIVSALSLILTLGTLLLIAGWMAGQLLAWTNGIIDQLGTAGDAATIEAALRSTLRIVAVIALPLVLVSFIAGIVGNVAQFGFLFATDPITPKFEKINPVEGAKKLFNRTKLLETLKSAIKILVIMLVTTLVFRHHLQDLVYIQHCGLGCGLSLAGIIIAKILAALVPLFAVLAAMDYAIKRAEFIRNQRMSHQDVKREHKNTEGNPEMKQNRKERQRELVGDDLRKSAAEATVLATDGVRLIAIKYHEKDTPVPMVTVMEKGRKAMQARQIAERNNRVVVEDSDATALLWAKCKSGHPVPTSLYATVAPLIIKAQSKAA